MKLLSFQLAGKPTWGAVVGDLVTAARIACASLRVRPDGSG